MQAKSLVESNEEITASWLKHMAAYCGFHFRSSNCWSFGFLRMIECIQHGLNLKHFDVLLISFGAVIKIHILPSWYKQLSQAIIYVSVYIYIYTYQDVYYLPVEWNLTKILNTAHVTPAHTKHVLCFFNIGHEDVCPVGGSFADDLRKWTGSSKSCMAGKIKHNRKPHVLLSIFRCLDGPATPSVTWPQPPHGRSHQTTALKEEFREKAPGTLGDGQSELQNWACTTSSPKLCQDSKLVRGHFEHKEAQLCISF